jgi:hypothetical protein
MKNGLIDVLGVRFLVGIQFAKVVTSPKGELFRGRFRTGRMLKDFQASNQSKTVLCFWENKRQPGRE